MPKICAQLVQNATTMDYNRIIKYFIKKNRIKFLYAKSDAC